ncbi:SOS response-associated peptidase [Marinifilum sp. D714]|uniref:SOS response-associated peptidase n=1 Tax=Marinifilum sp. D714 TaxID=2937523 RepID=UPI0027BDF1C3|nr:SOS response-associated peptidase [Marinifilum sp. D714]MDQ2178796.1 SOS response-associated peptidase [Marinifilum sp. D714]
MGAGKFVHLGMCYGYSSSKLAERFARKMREPKLFERHFYKSGFEFPLMPVVCNDQPEEIGLAAWGLIPAWAKDKSMRKYTLNARSETIFEKPSFKKAIASQRCLILADGFYEWQHVGKNKYPYFIGLKNEVSFAFAGIWDLWENPESKELVKSYSIITTEANGLMAKIHNTKKRMPLILPVENEDAWLKAESKNEIMDLLKLPIEEDEMFAYTVQRKLANEASAQDQFVYEELSQGRMF